MLCKPYQALDIRLLGDLCNRCFRLSCCRLTNHWQLLAVLFGWLWWWYTFSVGKQ
jgi:hypothetical protein